MNQEARPRGGVRKEEHWNELYTCRRLRTATEHEGEGKVVVCVLIITPCGLLPGGWWWVGCACCVLSV